MTKMLRWAVLGTGFISHKMIEAIRASDGSTLHVIAGRDTEKTSAFKSQHGFAKAASFDAALSDPEVDVVYIATPNHTHHSLTIKAAEAGKPVVSEKSLTTTMADAKALAEAVTTHGNFFVEGLMYLAHPLHKRLHEILLDGRLGQLRAIHGFYAADIWQVTNPKGCGTLYNLGCYPVSLAHLVIQTLCGDSAFSGGRLKAHGIISPRDGTVSDASVTAKFEVPNGPDVLVNLHATDSYGMDNGFVIAGDNGVLRCVTNPWLPLAGRNHLQWCPYDGEVKDIHVDASADAFFHQVKMVEAAIVNGQAEATRPSPRIKDSLEIMEFLTNWEREIRQDEAAPFPSAREGPIRPL